MTAEEYVAGLPLILDEVAVRRVERISPSFVRLELGGDCLADFGVDGRLYDQRFKLIFPNAAGGLPTFADADESWWTTWRQIPENERGSMRTYTIRDVAGQGDRTRLVVDIVVHEHGDQTGPGNDWALQASVGDRLMTMAPRRGHDFGGIEFAPGAASTLLIVGDETALPAVSGILRDLDASARGTVVVEVPVADDVLHDVRGPAGVEVVWLPRDGASRGERLRAAVLERLAADVAGAAPAVGDDEVDPDLWETPRYSSSGESVSGTKVVRGVGTPYAGLYAWIAGESKRVTGLRRHLVSGLGIDRSQVAFMGYWREGVAMRS